jgi:protein-S-isoprenylcysteine O-methyltransferase Ste14
VEAAHRARWEVFEVVFGVPFLIALALQLAVPLSLPRGPLALVFVLLGAALIAGGLALLVLARRELARRGQPTDPGRPTSNLVTTGVFSISRNPLYLGGICFLIGVALVGNLPWGLVLLVPALVVCHFVLIAPEERYLAARFPREYEGYRVTVRRWFGRSRASS